MSTRYKIRSSREISDAALIILGNTSGTNTGDSASIPIGYLDTDGTLAGNSDVSVSSEKAVKTYVDNLALGLVPKPSAHAATTTTLPTNTYSNGASGVGATLTAITVGVLTVDGIALALNDYILVKNEVLGYTNGLYVVTTAGAVGVAYILTRDVTMNQTAEFSNSLIVVENGTSNAGTIWLDSNNGSITVGTTVVTFTQIPTAGAPIAGTGISVSGATVSIDTGVTVDKTTAQTLSSKTLTSPVINTPTGIAKGDVGLGNVDNTSNTTERAATATLTNKTLTSPKINEDVAITATATELNYTDGVTSAIQTQLNAKAASLGADDNYATDAEKVKLSNLSNTNTGDQTLPVKATGAEINTGTDDAKFATAKAISDSVYNLSAYAESTSVFTGSASTADQDITSLSATIVIPTGGRRIKITVFTEACDSNSAAGETLALKIKEGSTQLSDSTITIRNTADDYYPMSVMYSAVATAGSHTYKAAISNTGAGRPRVVAAAIRQSFILVETI